MEFDPTSSNIILKMITTTLAQNIKITLIDYCVYIYLASTTNVESPEAYQDSFPTRCARDLRTEISVFSERSEASGNFGRKQH